jgi:GxxExxY protein
MEVKESILIHRELTESILGAAMRVHNQLGPGFLEKVYENALCIELRKRELKVQQQHAVVVYYDGNVVGEYQVDILVEGKVLIELKAVEQLCAAHCAQLVNYLKATRMSVGLLLNFGSPRLTWERMANTNIP